MKTLKINFFTYFGIFARKKSILPFLAKIPLFAVFEKRFSDFSPKLSSCNCNRDIKQHKLSVAVATATGMGKHDLLRSHLQILLVTATATELGKLKY